MYMPVIIKADLQFTIDDVTLDFEQHNISAYGAYGLEWSNPPPNKCLGKKVTVTINILSPEVVSFSAPALIMREKSSQKETMALKFDLKPSDRDQLNALIEKGGFYPTEYVRKYPRIPASQDVKTFPLKAIATVQQDEGPNDEPVSLIMDVENLSPGGIMLKSENHNAFAIQPGERFHIMLEARGDFHSQIHVMGLICRVIDEQEPKTGNLSRYFGIKFTHMDDQNRSAFLELLKGILTDIKKP
jgi:hypothetical protein